MTKIDVAPTITAALKRLEELQVQRNAIAVEIAELQELITAAAKLLPDEKRELMDVVASAQELYRLREVGVTEAIRAILKHSGQWLTATDVRDRLVSSGFDFSNYKSNPLASVATVLRRLELDNVESSVDRSPTAYRWKGEKVFLDEEPPYSLKQNKRYK
jgi:hypothetical protein